MNGIVERYAEPAFHCSVHLVPHPTSGDIYPIIGVPGDQQVPIRARRSGPHGQVIKSNAIYIRRPGPQSAEPRTGLEWDKLFKKCLNLGRAELLEQFRNMLTGVSPPTKNQDRASRLKRWTNDCAKTWSEKVRPLPKDGPARFPHGSYTFSYEIDGATRLPLPSLLDVLREAPKLTGWNTWWVPSREEIAPYPVDGAIECWIGGDPTNYLGTRDAAHSDFWRVSPEGLAFLRRGYQEDGDVAVRQEIVPGTRLDATLPIWRVGEGLLHAAYLAQRIDGTTISFAARYTGLRSRRLIQIAPSTQFGDWTKGVSRVDDVMLETVVDSNALDSSLVEVVHALLSPLYEKFDFTRLPRDVVQYELARLRGRR